MTVKNEKHKFVGLVNLGGVHTAMRTLSGITRAFTIFSQIYFTRN